MRIDGDDELYGTEELEVVFQQTVNRLNYYPIIKQKLYYRLYSHFKPKEKETDTAKDEYYIAMALYVTLVEVLLDGHKQNQLFVYCREAFDIIEDYLDNDPEVEDIDKDLVYTQIFYFFYPKQTN